MLLREYLEHEGVKDSQYMKTKDAGVGDSHQIHCPICKEGFYAYEAKPNEEHGWIACGCGNSFEVKEEYTTGKTKRTKDAGVGDVGKTVYKKHFIIETFSGDYIVERDGHRMCTKKSMEEAKKEIDMLTKDAGVDPREEKERRDAPGRKKLKDLYTKYVAAREKSRSAPNDKAAHAAYLAAQELLVNQEREMQHYDIVGIEKGSRKYAGDAVADRVKVTKQDSDKRGRIGIIKSYQGDKPLVKFPDGDEVLFNVGDLEKQGTGDAEFDIGDFFSTDAPDYYGAIVAIARRADNPKMPKADILRNLAPIMKVQGVEFNEAEFEKSYKQFSSARMGREYEKSRDASTPEPDPAQLRMGIKVEHEHTDDPAEAEKIARDHLAEIPDYYTRLMKMEKEAGK